MSEGSISQSIFQISTSSEVSARRQVASDEPTAASVEASDEFLGSLGAGRQRLVAPDEPTPTKKRPSVHPTVPFSVAVDPTALCLWGLFIPPLVAHLKLLECAEVHCRVRHIYFTS